MPKKKKRKYVRKSGAAAIAMVSRIRTRNNKNWMAILNLAISARPREAKKLLQQIVENDREITKWMDRV